MCSNISLQIQLHIYSFCLIYFWKREFLTMFDNNWFYIYYNAKQSKGFDAINECVSLITMIIKLTFPIYV